MPMQARIGGAWKTPTVCKAYVGGQWRSIRGIKAYVDGAWRDVANFTTGAGTITLTPSVSSITRNSRQTSPQAGPVTFTPSGGQSPYTYSTVHISGDAISVTTPASASTYFRASTAMEVDETRSAVFRCTATDAFGSTATADVSISLTRIEFDLGGNL